MGHVRVRPRCGPAHGREVSIDADRCGRSVLRVNFPAALPHGARSASVGPPMLVYERLETQLDGMWVFGYVGLEFG